MERPIFEFVLNEEGDHFTTSIVKDPAVESTLMYFKAEEDKPLFFANEEKRIIYAVAMVPNKMIFRKETDAYPAHYGFFTAETIEKFQENYTKFNGNEKTNINHEDNPVKGVYRLENWIVKDSEVDKSKAIGLKDVKEGSLIMAFKIENEDVWAECKNGNLDGLSIEAHLNRKPINNFKNEEMSKEKNPQTLWDMMKAYFSADAPEETEEEKAARLAEEEKKKAEEMADEAPADETDYKAENEMLTAKVAELEAKLATMEADKVKDSTELATMKAEKETAIADLAKFKAETPATPAVKDLPKEDFNNNEPKSAYEKFREHNKKFKK